MSYICHKKDIVDINGFKFNEEVLKTFDPDFESPPEGWVRYYKAGRKHCLTNGRNQIGCDYPWKKGDNYIKSLMELKLVQQQLKLDQDCSH